jgi:hypothetical protein
VHSGKPQEVRVKHHPGNKTAAQAQKYFSKSHLNALLATGASVAMKPQKKPLSKDNGFS